MVGSALPMAATRTSTARSARAVHSTWVLLGAVLLICAATALILVHDPRIAGVVVLVAGGVILWGWYLAHAQGGARARFLSMLVDPLHDAAILGAVAWVARPKEPRVAALALVALGVCYVASYERARADALGFRTFESVGYRAVRSALIGIGLLAAQMTIALWLVIAVGGAALVARAANVAIQHRKPGRDGASP